jgi:regulatory protein YycI of two-component signal transduction system YycFG
MARSAQDDKRSTNWGVIMLMIILVLLMGVISWFVFFDKKVNMRQNTIMTNMGGQSLNSMSISNNSAYGFNSRLS